MIFFFFSLPSFVFSSSDCFPSSSDCFPSFVFSSSDCFLVVLFLSLLSCSYYLSPHPSLSFFTSFILVLFYLPLHCLVPISFFLSLFLSFYFFFNLSIPFVASSLFPFFFFILLILSSLTCLQCDQIKD